jgi:hypothetical protein
MNDPNQPRKSVWKKPLTPRMVLFLWGVLLLFVIALGILVLGLIASKQSPTDSIVTAVSLLSIGIAAWLVLIYIVWPLMRLLFWRQWRRTLLGLVCIATVIALFYAEEDWRGKRDWEKFKREWEAKGEIFDLASFIPPPVPDDQNFAMTPICIASVKSMMGSSEKLRSWYGDRLAGIEAVRVSLVRTNQDYSENDFPKMGSWNESTMTDLTRWQTYFRNPVNTNSMKQFPVATQPQSPAEDVLLALSKYEAAIEELRRASQLPYSRFPVEYEADNPFAILLPHLAMLKQYAQVLELRAIAELRLGQSEKAAADVQLTLRLANAVRTEPFLISHLVRIAILKIALEPVYEGLAEHRWSDAQLVALDSELAKLDFLTDYKLGMRGEVTGAAKMMDYIQRSRKISAFLDLANGTPDSRGDRALDYFCFALPSGWFHQNQIRNSQVYIQQCLPLVDLEHRVVSPEAAQKAEDNLEETVAHRNPYTVLRNLFLANLKRWIADRYVVVKKFAYAQESADLARVAIALERHRLTHGEYPETPQFMKEMPHDIIGGQPLKYHRTDYGTFVLYSVGWNEKDDGGNSGSNKGNSTEWDVNDPDWVWQYPAKSEVR